jgi:hypothetical protein
MLSFQNGAYSWMPNATMANGTFFDIILFSDMLANQLQTQAVNLLRSVPALPITDSGVNQMRAALAVACAQSQQIGFIAPTGTWLGNNIGTGSAAITTGQVLPNGYYLYAPAVSTLTQAQRGARQLPPFTIPIILAEAAQSLVITATLQL